ncbi:MAG TPA: inositol monophosphatase family protein, partial [Geminicoccaceae bacterium]
MLAPDLLLPQLLGIADRAGAVLLEYYASSELEVATKADRSPVTAADEAAERVILAALRELTPEVPVVAE